MSLPDLPASKPLPSALPRSEAGDEAELWRRCALDSPQGILLGHLNPDGHMRVLACNASFERITGYDRSEAEGHAPSELLRSSVSAADWAQMEQKLAQGTPFDSIVETRHRGGQVFLSHVNGYPLSSDAKNRHHWVLALADVAVAGGRIRREFEHLDGLGTLAGGIAHDFNNLLAIILGYASLLHQIASDNARVSEYSRTIADAATRGAEVVRQLMVFANQHEPVLVDSDIHQVLGDVLQRTTTEWPERVRLGYDFNATQSRLPVDPEQIASALHHVLHNARESISASGNVIVRTRDRGPLPNHNPAQEWLEIQVEDDGCGMDEETRTRMFEPFFARHKGAEVRGIGLALVYGIVRSHRGHIEVRSEPGQGTCICLLLPRASNAGCSPKDALEPSAYQLESSIEILLVEDEADLARLWSGLANKQGWELHWASNAEEALTLFQNAAGRIGLVFSDVGLPGETDGWELCSRLRAIRPDVPILLASGYFKQSTADQIHLAEPVAFIQKPYQLHEAIEAINELVKRKP